MFIGFMIVVFLGNLVCGQNDTEFIDSLPENERAELLGKIGDRISKEVQIVRKSNASDVEVSDAQMNEFDDFVNKILNEEENKLKQKLIIKETKNIQPTEARSTNLLNVKPIIKEVSKTQKPKLESKNSKGNSKIITIPFRLHDPAVIYSKSKDNVENTSSLPVPNKNVSTEKDPVMNNMTSNVNEYTSPKLVVTNVTEKLARKSEELIKKVENNVITTMDHISVPTATSIANDTFNPLKVDKETVNAEITGTSPIKENIIITSTQKTIPKDTINPLKVSKEEVNAELKMTSIMKESVNIPTTQKPIPIDTIDILKAGKEKVNAEHSNSEERMKRIKDRTQDPEAAFADEAKIMNQLFYQSTQNPVDIVINDTIGESGEKNYSIDESNTTKHKDNERIIKYRRHTNILRTQDILLQPSRRAESNHNVTYSSVGFNKHPWSQDQRNRYLQNSTLTNTANLRNSVNVSNVKNNNEMSLNKSENKTSHSNHVKPQLNDKNSKKTPKTNNVKPQIVDKNSKKPSIKVDRQNLHNYMPYSDERLPDTSWADYPSANEQPNSLSSWPPDKEFYTQHNESSESLQTLEDLLTNTALNYSHYSDENDLLEDTHTYARPKNITSYIHENYKDVASTSFTINYEITPKFLPTNTQTIKLPNDTPTPEDHKKESVENNRYKIITEVSTPLNKPNPSNKTIIPPGLVESLAYPKIKKKNKKNRNPLKLHITSGQNPVNIRIFYDKNYKKPKKLKISITRDKIDHRYTIPNNNNNIRFKSPWPRRNFGDNRALYVSDFFPSNDFEYTTLPSYLSYVPPLSYRPSYYKPEIPFTLFSKRSKLKEDQGIRNVIAEKKQEKYMLNNGEDDKYFGQIENPNKPAKLAVNKGQYYGGETNKLASQKIIQEINQFLTPDDNMKHKNRFQKVAIRNDRYLYKNPARCKFDKSGRSKNGNENDNSESDCRSSEEYDDTNPVSVNGALQETPKLITLIAVMSKNKPKVEVEEKEVLNLNKPNYTANAYPYNKKGKSVIFEDVLKADLLDPPTDIYKMQQEMYSKEAVADVINSQSHVTKKDKVVAQCPKQYDIDIYVETIGMLVLTEDDALRKFDWLSSTIDIQGAIQKLLLLSNQVTNNEKIHSADLELLRFVIYLRKLAGQRGVERESCRDDKKHVPVQEPDYKVMQKADWMLYSRTNDPYMDRELYEYYNNQSNENTEVLDFISFLNVLQTELYDLHSVIKNIAGVTKYNNQNWFGDIKNLYLDYATRQDLLGVLLHLSLTKIIDYVEKSATHGLTYNYIQYVIDHQEEILNIVDEFDFCSILTNEMEKNIYIN